MGQDVPKEAGKSSIIARNLRLMGHREKKKSMLLPAGDAICTNRPNMTL